MPASQDHLHRVNDLQAQLQTSAHVEAMKRAANFLDGVALLFEDIGRFGTANACRNEVARLRAVAGS